MDLELELEQGAASEDHAAIKIECKLRMHKTLIFMKPALYCHSC